MNFNNRTNMESCSPIFIISSGRCGSTLLQRILNSVEKTAIAGEHKSYLADIARSYRKIMSLAAPPGVSAEAAANTALEKLRDSTHWSAWTNWAHGEQVLNSYRELVTSLVSPTWPSDGWRWGFKEIGYGSADRTPEFLIELFPHCKIIALVRNPVDTIASMRQFYWQKGMGVEGLARTWSKNYSYYDTLAADFPDNVRIVYFEEMTDTASDSLGHLFEWLDLSLGEEQTKVLEVPEGRYESPVREGGVSPRNLLTLAQRQAIYSLTAETRRKYGYGIEELINLSDGVRTAKSNDGLSLHTADGTVHKMNQTADLILALCDGSRTLQDMIDTLEGVFPGDASSIREQVTPFIEQMLSANIVTVGNQ